MSSAMQWGRKCKLTVQTSSDSYQALEFSDLRISFYVSQALVGQPCSADIRVYNVSNETEAMIQEEGTWVILEAGYPKNMGVIFRGQIRQRYIGRESQTDTFLHIIAASGDMAHVYGVINANLAAGSKPADTHKVIADSFSAHGITSGTVPNLPTTELPRGKAMYGPTRDFAQVFADTHKLQWGYANSEYVCVADNGIVSSTNDAIVINTETGMIGMPQVTINGVYVSCLLNPDLDFKSIVKLDNKSIQFEAISTANNGAQVANDYKGKKMLSADGLYKVISREHTGDTRGDAWYTDLICVGINAELQPLGGAAINAVDNP